MIRLAAALAVVSLAACAAGEERSLAPDLAYPRYDASVDGAILDRGPAPDIVFPDGSTPTPDSAPPSPDGPTCQIGTPDNCKSCGHICPGSDSPTTARVCLSGGICNIECKGEHYDVNGDHLDGCELEDDLPIHDVESAAKSLGNVSDCNNKKSTTARMPSDQRRHQKAPVERELGRADWFSMHISDNSGSADEHLPPGAGSIDFQWLVRELKAAGFDASVTFEIFTGRPGDLESSRERFMRLWRG